VPTLTAVGRAEQGRVFHPGVDRVGVRNRWLEVPDSLEHPILLSTVVKLVKTMEKETEPFHDTLGVLWLTWWY
jgi:hypothetical protein